MEEGLLIHGHAGQSRCQEFCCKLAILVWAVKIWQKSVWFVVAMAGHFLLGRVSFSGGLLDFTFACEFF
jgi:hypothetical protein